MSEQVSPPRQMRHQVTNKWFMSQRLYPFLILNLTAILWPCSSLWWCSWGEFSQIIVLMVEQFLRTTKLVAFRSLKRDHPSQINHKLSASSSYPVNTYVKCHPPNCQTLRHFQSNQIVSYLTKFATLIYFYIQTCRVSLCTIFILLGCSTFFSYVILFPICAIFF